MKKTTRLFDEMRKIFTIIIILVGLSVSTYAQTGTPQDILKKAVRDAKELVKAGWKSSVKMPPIERQLNNAYLREARILDDGYPQYIMGYSRRRGMNYQKVHSEAVNAARAEISKKFGSDVWTEYNNKIKSDGSNTSHMFIRALSVQKLKKAEPVVDIFREYKDGEVEIEVRIAYDTKGE